MVVTYSSAVRPIISKSANPLGMLATWTATWDGVGTSGRAPGLTKADAQGWASLTGKLWKLKRLAIVDGGTGVADWRAVIYPLHGIPGFTATAEELQAILGSSEGYSWNDLEYFLDLREEHWSAAYVGALIVLVPAGTPVNASTTKLHLWLEEVKE